MRKVIVFQHVAHEILGTLNPLLKAKKFRVRYVNFERTPELRPSIEKYNGLVILGGHMGVYESDLYKHIKTEMALIEQALKKQIPILGICLGAQILAHVLGAPVRKHTEREMGWCDVQLTPEGMKDRLLDHFSPHEKIFQMHGDTFEIPRTALHLARSEVCEGQAFCYQEKAYGLQFHLEVDEAMIKRWLKMPHNLRQFSEAAGKTSPEKIEQETQKYLAHSIELSTQTFSNFLAMFGLKERKAVLGSGHGKSKLG